MKSTIWMSIATTPWWMYLIALYVLVFIYYSTSPAIVPIKKLSRAALLLVVITFGIIIYFKAFSLTLLSQAATLTMLGAGIGWLGFRRKKIITCPKTKTLHLPRSWSLVWIAALGLTYKYFSGYEIQYNFGYYYNIGFTKAVLAYSAALGLLSGKYAYARYCLKNGPFLPQKPLTFER